MQGDCSCGSINFVILGYKTHIIMAKYPKVLTCQVPLLLIAW